MVAAEDSMAEAEDSMAAEEDSTAEAAFMEVAVSTAAADSAAEAGSMAEEGSAVVADFEVQQVFEATAFAVDGAEEAGADAVGVDGGGVGEDGAGAGVGAWAGVGPTTGIGRDTDTPIPTDTGTIPGRATMARPTTQITTLTMTGSTLLLPLGVIATTATPLRRRPRILPTSTTGPRTLPREILSLPTAHPTGLQTPIGRPAPVL